MVTLCCSLIGGAGIGWAIWAWGGGDERDGWLGRKTGAMVWLLIGVPCVGVLVAARRTRSRSSRAMRTRRAQQA